MNTTATEGFSVLPLEGTGTLILSAYPCRLPGTTPERAIDWVWCRAGAIGTAEQSQYVLNLLQTKKI